MSCGDCVHWASPGGAYGDCLSDKTRVKNKFRRADQSRCAQFSGDVTDIEDHIARVCECGSVSASLLKSGKIECSGCSVQFGEWSDAVRGCES